jgi:hypothetical protein
MVVCQKIIILILFIFVRLFLRLELTYLKLSKSMKQLPDMFSANVMNDKQLTFCLSI